MKRNKSERSVETVERDEKRYWKIDSRMLKKDDVKDRWFKDDWLLIVIETHAMVAYL